MRSLLKLIFTSASILFCFTSFIPSQPFKKFTIGGRAQGTTYSVTYYAMDSVVTAGQIASLLGRVDSSLSIYKPYSLISRFNETDKGIEVDEYLETVVVTAKQVCRLTDGVFDITVMPLVQAWGFGTRQIDSLPDKETIRRLKKCVNSEFLRVKDGMLLKKKPCVKIDVNGIAQGYTVDLMAELLEANGVRNYIVELGGEIRVKGRKQPGNEKMRIGIESPSENEFEIQPVQHVIEIDSGAITTSGSYRKYYETEGKRITHIIDARTGYPAQNELISVTVFADNAIIADALDNALMAMGLKKALNFVEKRNDIAAHFIYRTENGAVADTASSQFYKLFKR